MNRQEHNGWTNYETWVVALWIDNEHGSQDAAREEAARCQEDQTQQVAATIMLADILKAEHEGSLPELTGFASDLLKAAMSEVNWYEIAEHLVEERTMVYPDQEDELEYRRRIQ